MTMSEKEVKERPIIEKPNWDSIKVKVSLKFTYLDVKDIYEIVDMVRSELKVLEMLP
jgi:hypothetical protein